jgi:predicted nucleic acid-binding Zn ribbon protein
VLSGPRIESRQHEATLVQVWNESLDPNLTAHPQPTCLRKGTRFVTVDSHVWPDEILRYRRDEILERLQASFGSQMVFKMSARARQEEAWRLAPAGVVFNDWIQAATPAREKILAFAKICPIAPE